MKSAQQFEIGTRVRLLHAPEWIGEVCGHDPDGSVRVQFQVDALSVVGRHSPDALEVVEP
jgi:hypothetical protein